MNTLKPNLIKPSLRLFSCFLLLQLVLGCSPKADNKQDESKIIKQDESKTIFPTLKLSAIKGPLEGAFVFLDRNANGVYDVGEEYGITNKNGEALITPTSDVSATDQWVANSIEAGQTIGEITYPSATIDTNTGGEVSDLILTAPADATVITPITTLVKTTGLSVTEVNQVLELPENMDLLNFNPYANESDSELALAAEKVALKLNTTVGTIQALAKELGLDNHEAHKIAMGALSVVMTDQSIAGYPVDLSEGSVIDEMVGKAQDQLTDKLQESGLDEAEVAAALTATSEVMDPQQQNKLK